MEDEFEKQLRALLKSCQEYLDKNLKDFYYEGETDINCPVHKKINVKYIGSRFYVDEELIGEPAPYDYHRKFYLISFESKYGLSSFNATWCDHTLFGAIDYWKSHLANPKVDIDDDWSINRETKQEFIKLFK